MLVKGTEVCDVCGRVFRGNKLHHEQDGVRLVLHRNWNNPENDCWAAFVDAGFLHERRAPCNVPVAVASS